MKGEGKGREGKRRGGGRGGEGPHTNAGTWAPSYLAMLLPLPPISRCARYYLMLNMSETVRDADIVSMEY